MSSQRNRPSPYPPRPTQPTRSPLSRYVQRHNRSSRSPSISTSPYFVQTSTNISEQEPPSSRSPSVTTSPYFVQTPTNISEQEPPWMQPGPSSTPPDSVQQPVDLLEENEKIKKGYMSRAKFVHYWPTKDQKDYSQLEIAVVRPMLRKEE